MKIIGAGLATVDIIQPCNSLVRPTGDKPVYTAGGTVCNILSYLGVFGYDCTVVGGIGDDPLGGVIKADLERFHVNTAGLLLKSGSLSRRIAHLVVTEQGDRQGHHQFATRCFACGADFPNFVPPPYKAVQSVVAPLLGGHTVLLIDRANALTLQMAQEVAAAGGIVVFEPGYVSRDRSVVEKLFETIDILKYSDELGWQGKPFATVMPQRHPRLKLLVETRSTRGVRAVLRNKELRLTTTPLLKVVDTAGAGDGFTAGLITGLLRHGIWNLQSLTDDALEEALQRGQALGALSCLYLGSKGLLYAQTQSSFLEEAIQELMRTRRVPDHFGSTKLSGMPVSVTKTSLNGICPVCYIRHPS